MARNGSRAIAGWVSRRRPGLCPLDARAAGIVSKARASEGVPVRDCVPGWMPPSRSKPAPTAPTTQCRRSRSEPAAQGIDRLDARAVGAEQVLEPHAAQLPRRPVERRVVGREQVEAAQGREHRRRRGPSFRAYSNVLTIPAWPQPETTTRPRAVSSTSDMSSGMVSSTRPPAVLILPLPLQFRSGCVRGTGPVSQAPGKISVGRRSRRTCRPTPRKAPSGRSSRSTRLRRRAAGSGRCRAPT